MQKRMNAQEKFQKILETHGGETANKSIKILLEDPELTELKPLTEFISKNWRDPFVPAMINLSCQAVNGNPKNTEEIAIAVSLMNLGFQIWDDIVDNTYSRRFNTTFVGKFGNDTALVIGGVVSAKAFTIINQANLDTDKKQKINEIIWTYWAKMAKAETNDLMMKTSEYSAKDKLNKIKDETINVKTCLKIGAIIGNGSVEEIEGLLEFGECLGILLEIVNDLKVSLNLTLELDKKITSEKLPYFILKAKETSKHMEKELDVLNKRRTIEPQEIGIIVNLLLRSEVLVQTKNYAKSLTKKGQEALKCLRPIGSRETFNLLIEQQMESFNEIF